MIDTLKAIYKTLPKITESVLPEHSWGKVIGERSSLLHLASLSTFAGVVWNEDTEWLGKFLLNSNATIMFPLNYFGFTTGFGFRSVENKRFSTYVHPYPIPVYTPQEGVLRRHTKLYSEPLVLVEGVADAEAVGAYYPWVVALLGSNLNQHLQPILEATNEMFYTMLDNDLSGQRGTKKCRNAWKERCVPITYNSEYKDPAEYYLADPAGLQRCLQGVGL